MADWDVAKLSRPLLHEDQQVGYLIECPECSQDIIVPVADFLEGNHKWSSPPQNQAFAANGWHYGWGTQEDPQALHLRQSSAVPHGDHAPGADDQIICNRREWTPTGDIANIGCGHAYRVVAGKLIEVA